MTKIYNKILLFLLVIAILPSTLILVGCGATPVNQARGVSFVSNVQNEKGQAVFELDLGSPIILPYKINPSSAYGYSPRFTAISGISGDNLETYSLDVFTGEFCINQTTFKDVEVEINVGNFTDVCVIKLKKYPINIGLYDETQPNKINASPKINLACGSAYQINVAGIMVTKQEEVYNEETKMFETIPLETETVLLEDSKYNFLIEADENSKTIINVANNNRLNITAYSNYGKAKVKVALCDYFKNVITDDEGNALFAFEIEINVHSQCETMDVKLSQANQIISSTSQVKKVNISAINLPYKDAEKHYIINYEVDFYDEYSRLINDESIKINCFANKTTYVSVNNDLQEIYVSRPPSGGTLNFNIEIWSNAALESGEFCMLDIEVNIIF